MGKLHEFTLRLADARLAVLQQTLDGSGIEPTLAGCMGSLRELKSLLTSGEVHPDRTEGTILLNNCQDIAEQIMERGRTAEALEAFETECLLLTHSGLAEEMPGRIETRMAEHVIRLLICLPPTGSAGQFEPFIDAATRAIPDPAAFSDALKRAGRKYMAGSEDKADD